jgi:hypothetical protein
MRFWAASLLGAVVLVGASASPATTGTPPVPDVTVIADSVMTAVTWHSNALAVMQKGLQMRWEVAVCRTLTGTSCPFDGERPATLVQVVESAGPSLGKTVVVECGYNDPEGTFAQDVESSIDALLNAGVTKILWVNLHDATPQLIAMNKVLTIVAAAHPQVTLLDWNTYADGHNDWFQTDLIHLTTTGGVGLATFLHAAVWRRSAAARRGGTAVATGAGRPSLLGAGASDGWASAVHLAGGHRAAASWPPSATGRPDRRHAAQGRSGPVHAAGDRLGERDRARASADPRRGRYLSRVPLHFRGPNGSASACLGSNDL